MNDKQALVVRNTTAAGPLSRSASAFAQRIAKLWEIGQSAHRKAFDAAMEIGRLLNQAKAQLPHGEFEDMVRASLPFTERQAERLMRVAGHPILTKGDTVSLLPPSVSTQYELSRLSNNALMALVRDATIHPGMTRDEAVALVRKAAQKANVERIRTHAKKHALKGEYLIGIADYSEEPTGRIREVESHYPTQDVEYLKNLRLDDGRHVRALFAHDSIIFFWTTDRHLWDGSAKAILDAWGFERRANMIWTKPQIGLGAFARSQHEQLIIGVRGKFPAPEPHLRNATVFSGEPWCDKHSAKPNRLYELIEQSYPGIVPRLELFARQKRDGWDGHGWEYPSESQPNQRRAQTRVANVTRRVVSSDQISERLIEVVA